MQNSHIMTKKKKYKNYFIKEYIMKRKVYDLSKLAPKSKDIEVKKDNENQEQLLVDYEDVSPEKWSKLAYGTHIRYLRKDGTFRRGGFIKAIWVSDGIIKIDLASSMIPTANNWRIVSNTIDKIWMKKTERGLEQNYTEIKDDVEYCKKSIEFLKREIQKINNEMLRVVAFLKKRHT